MSSVDHAGLSWPGERPYLGGALLVVAGLLVGYVPLATDVLLMIKSGPVVTAIGLVSAILLTLTGVFAVLRPGLAPILGMAGILLSFLAVIGGLGGLLIGSVVAWLGGVLCIVWWVVRVIQGDSDER